MLRIIFQNNFKSTAESIQLCRCRNCLSIFNIANRILRKGTCSIELCLIQCKSHTCLNNTLTRGRTKCLYFHGCFGIQFSHQCCMLTDRWTRFALPCTPLLFNNNGSPILVVHGKSTQLYMANSISIFII